MLSIGKLAHVATLTRSQLQLSEAAQKSLEVIDDRMEIVACQNRLLETCRSTLDAKDILSIPGEQAKKCTQKLGPGLGGELKAVSPAFQRENILLNGNHAHSWLLCCSSDCFPERCFRQRTL